MKPLIFLILFFWIIGAAKAQDDYFDTPTMISLIDHNKQNYGDHLQLRDQQIVSQVTVSA